MCWIMSCSGTQWNWLQTPIVQEIFSLDLAISTPIGERASHLSFYLHVSNFGCLYISTDSKRWIMIAWSWEVSMPSTFKDENKFISPKWDLQQIGKSCRWLAHIAACTWRHNQTASICMHVYCMANDVIQHRSSLDVFTSGQLMRCEWFLGDCVVQAFSIGQCIRLCPSDRRLPGRSLSPVISNIKSLILEEHPAK